MTSIGITNIMTYPDRSAITMESEKNLIIKNYRRLSYILISLSVILWSISINIFNLKIGEYGLIHSLNPLFFISVVLLILSLFITIRENEHDTSTIVLQIILLMLFFSSIPFLVEGLTPRFPYNFETSRNLDYLLQKGYSNKDLIPYQSWPGIFYLGTIMILVLGINIIQTILIIPVIFKLILLLISFLLFRLLLDNKKEIWAAFLLNGTLFFGGPSFSVPGSLGALLTLFILYIFIEYNFFELKQSFAHKIVFIILSCAVIISHLLSSLNLFIILILMVAFKSIIRRQYPAYTIILLVLSLIFAWQVYAVGYYSINIFASAIKEALNIEYISSDIKTMGFSGSATHTSIVYVRFISGFILLFLAFLGISSQIFREKRISLKVSILSLWIIGNSLPLILTSYSGEVLSRVFSLNYLPLVAFSAKTINGRILSLIFLILIIISPVFSLINAYGNERVDYISPVELVGAEFLFNHSSEASSISGMEQRTWIYRYVEKLKFRKMYQGYVVPSGFQNNYLLIGAIDMESHILLYGDQDKDVIENVKKDFPQKIYSNIGFDLYLK